jgi:LacI family transcriptional regulator
MQKTPRGTGRSTKQRPTLKTIAELTGLSLSTVSLALRGGGALKEETSRKVAEAAKQLGYVPDRAGVRLRTGKTNVIALVLSGDDEAIDFARHMILGIGKAISGTRYHLNVMPEFPGSDPVESVRYILENRVADGVIITHTTPRDPRVQLLMDHDFPFVSHGRTEFYTPHAAHDFHSEAFIEMAVNRLVKLGCRDLMLTIGYGSTTNYYNLTRSFRDTTHRLGVQGREHTQDVGALKPADLRALGQEIARQQDRPDGLICDSETRAMPLLGGLVEGGVKLGTDMKVICKLTSDVLPMVYPRVETIEEDVYAAGIELTRLLMRRIDGEAPDTLRTLGEPIPHWTD